MSDPKGKPDIEIRGSKGGANIWGSQDGTTKITEFNKEFNARTSITFDKNGRVIDYHGVYQDLGISIDLLRGTIKGPFDR
ncbi:MAG: hypothetical protein CH104c_0068 [Candidatus Woesebacteria bacterium]|jgi:hypothetical protein|nr:MAG: hypothetical protein CH104c_0068 [Candidatus Woesebacteria bacterium]